MICCVIPMHILTGLIFQPRPFTLSWYLFIKTIDTSPLCFYKVSESIYILHKTLQQLLMNIFILYKGYCSLYISTLAASMFTPSTNGFFLYTYIDS